jgi:hypothetical protein
VAKNNGMKAARPLREISATIETVRTDGGVIGREGIYTLLGLLGAGERLDAQFHNLRGSQHICPRHARAGADGLIPGSRGKGCPLPPGGRGGYWAVRDDLGMHRKLLGDARNSRSFMHPHGPDS